MFRIKDPRLLFAGGAALFAVILLFPSSQAEAQDAPTLRLVVTPQDVNEGEEVQFTLTISPPVTETVYLQVGDGGGGPGYASYCEGDYTPTFTGADLTVLQGEGLNGGGDAQTVTFKYKAEQDEKEEVNEKVPVSVSANLDPSNPSKRTVSNSVEFTILDGPSAKSTAEPRCLPAQNPPPQNPPPQNPPPQNPPPQNPPPTTDSPPTLSGDTTPLYAENGTGPVATYTATDPENNQIAWRLSGSDGADFSIIRGVLTFNAGPDYEDPSDSDRDNVYNVTVEASDGANTVTLAVTVTVTNVNEPPRFAGSSTARSASDGTGAGENIGVPVEAADPEGDALTYSLGGTDATSFDIAASTGQLTTKSTLDRATRSSYSVTVSASDSKNANGNVDTATDDTIDVTITVTGGGSGSSLTTLRKSIPRQFVPINGGVRKILLSDHFSDSDRGHPPYHVMISDSAIATVEVSEGYLGTTPQGIGVATTTLTVNDSPSIREVFRTIVYRPVLPRTNTETVHIVDPDVDTTLTSGDGRMSVTFAAGAKHQFFQAAIDPLSNDCGGQSPVDERRLCVLVDLFDLAAESMEESLDVVATLSLLLGQQQYNTVQADLDNGDFTMWKGHGPSDTSWSEIPQCAQPRENAECFSLVQSSSGGKVTVFNITSFSQFDVGLVLPDPTPQPQPIRPSPPTNPPGNDGSSDSNEASRSRATVSTYSSGPTLRILGPVSLNYAENGIDPVASYTIEETDVDEIVWSVYGERKPFTISTDGVLSFKTPPDFENLSTREGVTYWVQIHAEMAGSPRRDDVLNAYVTVTQVNEIGAISGDSELSVPENETGAIARYQLDDPENGVISWKLTGPDAHAFEIDAQGNLSSVHEFDFEAPSSSQLTNVHSLTITATDDGKPELAALVDVTVTVGDVNEPPVAATLPTVDLTTEHAPWTLDLGEFFTDPDGDSLTYRTAGKSNPDVAVVTIEDGTLSIAPVGGGNVSFEVAATDTGGLRAASAVNVSVTEPPKAESSPVPAKVTNAILTETPEPASTVVDGEPVPGPGQLLSPLSERRYRNLTQQPDGVSKVIVAFALEPVESQPSELELPPLEPTPAPKISLKDDNNATLEDQSTLPIETNEAGSSGPPLRALGLLILFGLTISGYAVRMVVLHRVSESLWQVISRLRTQSVSLYRRPT